MEAALFRWPSAVPIVMLLALRAVADLERSSAATPNPPAGDVPATAVVVSGDGAFAYDATNGTTAGPVAGCSNFGANPKDFWFRYDAAAAGAVTVSNCPQSTIAPGGSATAVNDTYLAVWTGTPGGLTLLDCADGAPDCSVFESELTFLAAAGQPYYVQVGSWGSDAVVTGSMAFKRNATDECAGAPALSSGLNGPFENVSATVGGLPSCAGGGADVWLSYDATSAGVLTVTTVAGPSGFPLLSDPTLQLFAGCGGAQLACVDDAPFVPVGATVSLYGPTTVAIRVAGASGAPPGWFGIDVAFSTSELRMTSPTGSGSLRIENFGTPGVPYFSVFTFNQGAFPNGAFAGISPFATEVLIQLQSNVPPFVGALDASGTSSYGPLAGLPPLTIYGVSFFLTAAGAFDVATAPVAYAVP